MQKFQIAYFYPAGQFLSRMFGVLCFILTLNFSFKLYFILII